MKLLNSLPILYSGSSLLPIHLLVTASGIASIIQGGIGGCLVVFWSCIAALMTVEIVRIRLLARTRDATK